MTSIRTAEELAGAIHVLVGHTTTNTLMLVGLHDGGEGRQFIAAAGLGLPTSPITDQQVDENACRAVLALQVAADQELTHLMLVAITEDDRFDIARFTDLLANHARGHELVCDTVVERRGNVYREIVDRECGPWLTIDLSESWVELAAARGPIDETPIPPELTEVEPGAEERWNELSDAIAGLADPDAVGALAGLALYRRLRPTLDEQPSNEGLRDVMPLLALPLFRSMVLSTLVEEGTRERTMAWAALCARSTPGSMTLGEDLREDFLVVWIMGAVIGRDPRAHRALQYAMGVAPANLQLAGIHRTLERSGPMIASVALEAAIKRVSGEAEKILSLDL